MLIYSHLALEEINIKEKNKLKEKKHLAESSLDNASISDH